MGKKKIKFVQEQLNKMGLDAGPVDGLMGPKTRGALNRADGIDQDWPDKKKITTFIQLVAQEECIDVGGIDGMWGPATEFAFDMLLERFSGEEEADSGFIRPEDLPDDNPNNWPSQRTDEELIRFYGQPGQNQTRIQLPYPHKIAWNTEQTVNSFLCHEKVHDSLKRILDRVLDAYGPEEISRLRLDMWGGCLNVRKMRGGTRYSTHSWGIAVDYDPVRNQLNWGRDKAVFARPEYNTWWELWEEEGWVSLGRARNFDWMHVQAAKL